MGNLNKHPEIAARFETLRSTRRDEILSEMVETDKEYNKLRQNRADASMALKAALEGEGQHALLEAYSDAVYAQEVYELDAVYKQALRDAINVFEEHGLI